MPILLYPLALLGLATIPAVVGIYLLRGRSRRQVVSSMLLWEDQYRSSKGGLHLEKMQTPLLFFLELLAMALIILAACGPRLEISDYPRNLVVVLDDSWSMRAGGKDSPRSRAEAELRRIIDEGGSGLKVQLILAGDDNRVINAFESPNIALDRLVQWECRASSCDLKAALCLARSVGGGFSRVLVLSDHPPVDQTPQGNLEWRSFGQSLPNLAIINGGRTSGDKADRLLVEVGNLSAADAIVPILVEGLDGGGKVQRLEQKISANSSKTIVFAASSKSAVTVRLPDDAIDVDNVATFLPYSSPKVKVRLAIADKKLSATVAKALLAAGQSTTVASGEELLIADSDVAPTSASAWVFRIAAGSQPASYTGPFIINRSHPLAEGLELQGVIWGADGKQADALGVPVVSVGNVVVLSDKIRYVDRHDIFMNFDHARSTLAESINWPVLIWNTLRYRQNFLPGLSAVNYRLGDDVRVRLGDWQGGAEFVDPLGSRAPLRSQDSAASVVARIGGVYTVKVGGAEYQFAVNCMNAAESNVLKTSSGQWGNWLDQSAKQREYKSIVWLLAIIAAAVLTLHLALLAGRTWRSQ